MPRRPKDLNFAGYDLQSSEAGLSVRRERIDTTRSGDYGADPVGDGTFRMVPSGDIVDLEEKRRRLGPKLTPNRALTRHKLEAIAWEKTPRDYRGSSGTKREVLINTTEGTTLVPLGDLTDYQLRRYIGPGALEEAGDMRTNGGDEEERFLEALKASLDIGDRQIFFELSKRNLRVYIQFYNVPQGISGGSARENNRLMLIAEGSPSSGKIRVELTVRGPSFGEAYKLRSKTASPEKAAEYVAEFLNRAAKKAPYGHDFGNYDKNASRGQADEVAARELSLYIENEYSLVGAPNSQGKAIEKNLLGHLRRGNFDLKKAEIAYMHLMETGAKKYAKEFASERDWHQIFSVPTRELVAHEFASTFAEEHGASKSLAPNAHIETDEFDAPAHWASAFINGDTSGLEEDDLAEFEAWCDKHPELYVVDVSEETHIGRWNGLQTELATYTAHVQEGS